jgi:LacI family transcriptional regulator
VASVRDVAALAGVSVGTVSRVVNGRPDVTPKLRARVEAAMTELDYQPNHLARNFRRQRSRTIGVVVPDITAPFFAELVKQIEAAAVAADYTVLVGNSANRPDRERAYLARLREHVVDGLVFAPSTEATEVAPGDRSRVVVVDREIPGLDLVACDHEAGAREAVRHLLDLGHRRVACVSGPLDVPVFRQRFAGYREEMAPVLAREGIDPVDYARFEPLAGERGLEAAGELLALETPPTAIFATSDQQAIGVLRACADRGLRTPEDVSVVGFDDIPLAELMQPRLTTVRQPTEEIGRLVVERLMSRLDDRDQPAQRHVLPGELVVRASSGPAPL